MAADTGTGMDRPTLGRAAEPFFTTKAPGTGTGLGLAMAKEFAERSGGAMAIESTPGQGTRVTLWLPQAMPGAPSGLPLRAAPGKSRAVAHSRILLVDDDEMVLAAIAEQLRENGCMVLTAKSGAAALDILDTGEPVGVLITDLSMPGGMDGRALIAAARARRPGLPAILLTGWVEEAAPDGQPGAFLLLHKPVGFHELAGHINSLLTQAGP